MTDPNRPSDDAVKPAQTGEPVVSKPYIMPDDPEEGSNEALTKELAEVRDKMLRTLAEIENLRQRTRREVADSKMYGITGFARDILDIRSDQGTGRGARQNAAHAGGNGKPAPAH